MSSNKKLHDAIEEELSGAHETTPQPLLETNPDFDSPEAFGEAPADFDMGAETRLVTMTPDMQRALDAGVTLQEGKLEPIPAQLEAELDFGNRRVKLTKSLTIIGRVKEVSDISLEDDDQVSRHHAAVTYVKGGFYLQDLDSTNGTFVDGKRVRRSDLKPDVPVRVGMTTFTLRARQQ